MFLFYSTVPIILKICGATMLNLSLLTSDMWAVLIRIFAYHEKVDWMYFVAFAGTAIGLVIYSYKYCAFPVFCSLNMDSCIAMILYWCQYSPLKKLLQAGAQSRLLKRLHRLQGPGTRRLQR